MDERTAYSILKIRPGTSIEDISKKHDHFAKLYKKYLMREPVNMTPEEIEQMKSAYEYLVYKRIDDQELETLYPLENNSLSHQLWKELVRTIGPFLILHKAKVIYTLVMCAITFIIICVKNYQPVDLRIVVFSRPSVSIYEYEFRNQIMDRFESEILVNISGIERPAMELQFYYPGEDVDSSNAGLLFQDQADVYIMEESLLHAMKEAGIEFLALDRLAGQGLRQVYEPVNNEIKKVSGNDSGVTIDKETSLYHYICNWYGDGKAWVAAVSRNTAHGNEALRFIEEACGF